MINKKLGLILSSVIAGVGLVGATFAAWAVTDNANPLGIKISPTTISQDTDTYSTMVLEWGDTTTFTNISNLGLGSANYKTVSLQVKSTYTKTGTDTQTGGNLKLELVDLTTASKAEGAPDLVKHLVVEAYGSRTGTGTELDPYVFAEPISGLTINDGTAKNVDIATESNVVKNIYFKVYIPDSVSQIAYNQMVSDVVYLQANWDKPSTVTPVSTQTIYFSNDGSYTPYVYAFKEGATINQNHAWPGVAMTLHDATNHIYKYDFNMTSFEKVIFSNNGANQTADLTVPAITAYTPYYNGTSWVAAPAAEEVTDAVYYLVGSMNAWSAQAAYKLENPTDGVYSIDVTVPEGGIEYKVLETTTNTYYGYASTEDGTANCTWHDAGNITISFSPTKTLNNGLQYINAVTKA